MILIDMYARVNQFLLNFYLYYPYYLLLRSSKLKIAVTENRIARIAAKVLKLYMFEF